MIWDWLKRVVELGRDAYKVLVFLALAVAALLCLVLGIVDRLGAASSASSAWFLLALFSAGLALYAWRAWRLGSLLRRTRSGDEAPPGRDHPGDDAQ